MSCVMPKAFILVMGLTGGGKSTFVLQATGDESIPIGEGLESQTHDTAEYIIEDYKGYEVHLIDTPGFDDSGLDDARVLQDIADWINYIYKDGDRISGVIYVDDITRTRLGGSGIRNVRLLEELLGREHWDRCTLVTAKWGETKRPHLEEKRERQLAETDEYWKKIRTGAKPAEMKRFDNTKESALAIIDPYLKDGFVPQITSEMVDPEGPQQSLGATGAGKQVSKYLDQLQQLQGKTKKIQRSKERLIEKFNQNKYQLYREKQQRLINHIKWKRVARWSVRMVTWGGCIAATVVTGGVLAPLFVAVGALEVGLQAQRQNDKQKLDDLAKDFHMDLQESDWNASTASMNDEDEGKSYENSLERRKTVAADASTTSLLRKQSLNSGSSSIESLGTQGHKSFC